MINQNGFMNKYVNWKVDCNTNVLLIVQSNITVLLIEKLIV